MTFSSFLIPQGRCVPRGSLDSCDSAGRDSSQIMGRLDLPTRKPGSVRGYLGLRDNGPMFPCGRSEGVRGGTGNGASPGLIRQARARDGARQRWCQ
jgi:hypothetical protein